MPAEVITTERYVMYSSDGSDGNDDNKSICSERNDCMLNDPFQNELIGLKHVNGKVTTSSPALSTATIDRWGSYWSKRERCCCFWNFILTVSLIVTVSVVILATKGFVFSNGEENVPDKTKDRGLPGYIAPINVECTKETSSVKTCNDDVCMRSRENLLRRMNTSMDPCQDFYSYACGGYMDKVRLSWNSPRKRMNPDMILESHEKMLIDIISDEEHTADSDEVKIIKKIYRTCVQRRDTSLVQIRQVMDSLGGFEFGSFKRTKEIDLTTLLLEVYLKYGISPLFELNVRKDGRVIMYNKFSDEAVERQYKHGRPMHRYRFLKPSDFFYRNEDTDLVLLAYRKYISDFLAYIMGINNSTISDELFVTMIDELYHLSVYINRVFYTEDVTTFSNEMSKCKQPISVDDLQSQCNYNISWHNFLSKVFRNSPFYHNFTICNTFLSTSLSDVLSGFSFTTLKQFIILQVLTESDITLLLPDQTPKFQNTSWNNGAFSGRVYSRLTDYDCLEQIFNHLPMHYVIPNHISDQFNDSLLHLFTDLISSIETVIKDLYWIPIQQKNYLLKELQGLTIHLEWKNPVYSSFSINMQNVSDDYFKNMQLMIGYTVKNFLSGHKQRVMTKLESSILFLINKEIDMPLSVMQAPFMYASTIPSLWFGSAGTYISQAISELFDIEALLRFLTEDKIDHKVALTIAYRLQCLLDEYNKYPLLTSDGHQDYIHGDLTKSENFKDSLALRVVYDTFSKQMESNDVHLNIPGVIFTQDQLFFLSYAQTMCEKTSKRGIRHYYIDNTSTHHSPGKYRIIGTLSHFKKFSEAFNCPASSEMNPQNKCSFF